MTQLDRRLRAQRPAKKPIDPWRPIGFERELELTPEGRLEQALTIFLAGRECAFTCIFCDLWQYTIDEPTPVGAIAAQIEQGLRHDRRQNEAPVESVKLYNASNFFDDLAVPPADDDKILELVRRIPRVIVECHARLVGERCERYARRLNAAGSRLEVAVGFETVHPKALAALNKRVDVDQLESAAARLRTIDADLRAFVLIGVPFIDGSEQLAWIQRTVETALEAGARLVSLIPLRADEGELQRLERQGVWRPPGLDEVEAAFETARALAPTRVRLDTWDLERLAPDATQEPRIEALRLAQLEWPVSPAEVGGGELGGAPS